MPSGGRFRKVAEDFALSEPEGRKNSGSRAVFVAVADGGTTEATAFTGRGFGAASGHPLPAIQIARAQSGSGPTGDSPLLGFGPEEDGTISIAPKSIQRLKSKVRELWEARQSLTSEQLRDQWHRYIEGWWNYFKLAERRWGVEDITGWILPHMRKMLLASLRNEELTKFRCDCPVETRLLALPCRDVACYQFRHGNNYRIPPCRTSRSGL